jgi:trans-aconitate 2-methyltransferase
LKYDWDATTYDHISDVIESWGHKTIERRKWKGNEIVLDAGCGSGRLTKILSIKVPHGKVFAVDFDLPMIRLAKENLAKISNIQFIKMDISEIELAEKVDVIFSNAVLHWILNHKKVFEHFWKILKPDGQLLVQCGGYGNLTKTLSILNKVRKSKEFYNYFCNNKGEDIWNEPWYFAKKEDTEKILQEIGFRNIQVFLENKEAKFPNKEDYFLFIKTIVLRPYLEYLLNDMLKDKFAKSVIQEIEANAKELQWKLDYVRLNINAVK